MHADYLCSNVRIIYSSDISLSCHQHNIPFLDTSNGPSLVIACTSDYDILDDHAYRGEMLGSIQIQEE